jgi:hypothetical protein
VRGGLDDALDKLARRDELRRRAAQEATGTPPEVQELVEAIAGVVGRHQSLEVTVGVEGAGDPTLLHFFVEDAIVRVTADSSVAARASEPRHADFDLEPEDTTEEQFAAPSFDAGTYHLPAHDGHYGFAEDRTDDIDAARFRSPFAATPPPPVPPQTSRVARSSPASHESTARLRYDDARPSSPAPHDTSSRPRYDDARPPASAHNGFGEETTRLAYAPPQPIPEPRAAADQQRGMPTPLPEPIPLRNVDSEETEQAAKRLAALLRDDPSLLRRDRP